VPHAGVIHHHQRDALLGRAGLGLGTRVATVEERGRDRALDSGLHLSAHSCPTVVQSCTAAGIKTSNPTAACPRAAWRESAFHGGLFLLPAHGRAASERGRGVLALVRTRSVRTRRHTSVGGVSPVIASTDGPYRRQFSASSRGA
jgi:hypothetical protein